MSLDERLLFGRHDKVQRGEQPFLLMVVGCAMIKSSSLSVGRYCSPCCSLSGSMPALENCTVKLAPKLMPTCPGSYSVSYLDGILSHYDEQQRIDELA